MIPSKTYRYTLKLGLQGHDVWALQINLNAKQTLITPLPEDGDFGTKTEDRVKRFQGGQDLLVDGIAGPVTQRALALALIEAPQATFKLPLGLMKGLVEGEANWIVGAVNWSVAGGVDCGWVQRRVLDSNFTDENFRRAFDGSTQFALVANELREKKDVFFGRVGAKTHQRAWELAILNHNWPWAADQLSKGHTLSTQPAQWVIDIGVPGVDTPAEWAEFYIDSKTMYVTNWSA